MYFDETAWVAVAFIIFIALVWKKASKAIFSILDNRSLLIHNELNEAKSLKEEALEELRKSLQTQKQVSEEADNSEPRTSQVAVLGAEQQALAQLRLPERRGRGGA